VSHPIRIVVDGRLSIAFDSNVVSGGLPGRTIIVTTEASDESRRARFAEAGCEMIVMGGSDGRVDLRELMRRLGEMKIASLMIEGGATIAEEALRAGIVDRIFIVVAPKIFGGRSAPSVIGGTGVAEVAEAWPVRGMRVRRLGPDLLIEGRVSTWRPAEIRDQTSGDEDVHGDH
jgi:diaminohydroxyphosphoribosylaminopyrimidine deaminase/5-amino-6-(5-phosphoribosylamino)uracil reductase